MIELMPIPNVNAYTIYLNERHICQISLHDYFKVMGQFRKSGDISKLGRVLQAAREELTIKRWLRETRYNRNRLQALILDKITPEEWAEIMKEIK